MKVFIVEDQPWFLEQLEELVASVPGAQVVGSSDTAQGAISEIRSTQPNVVLIDLMLKEGTGFEVIRSVRARTPNINLMVVASFPTPGIKKACLMAGANEFFDKLLEQEKVRSALENLTPKLN
jgi:DNA-binding NarL/FixJ family response regulator